MIRREVATTFIMLLVTIVVAAGAAIGLRTAFGQDPAPPYPSSTWSPEGPKREQP